MSLRNCILRFLSLYKFGWMAVRGALMGRHFPAIGAVLLEPPETMAFNAGLQIGSRWSIADEKDCVLLREPRCRTSLTALQIAFYGQETVKVVMWHPRRCLKWLEKSILCATIIVQSETQYVSCSKYRLAFTCHNNHTNSFYCNEFITRLSRHIRC